MKRLIVFILSIIISISLLSFTSAALTDGLKACWNFDESSGTNAYDSSGNNYNGTTYNMEDGDWIPGKIGNALQFDGVDEYVDTANIGITGNDPWTLSWWSVTDVAYEGTGNMLSIGPQTALNLIGINIVVGGVFGHNSTLLNYWTGTYNHYLSFPGMNFSDSFHHFFLTYDGTNVLYYINNTLEFTDPVPLNIIDNPVRIGGKTGGYAGQYLNGTIDLVVIWSRTLDATERAEIYNSYNGISCPFVPVDTCTCPGAGNNWEIDMSDFCNITEACDLTTGTLNFTGAGVTRCNASVDTTNLGDPGASGVLYIQDSCIITID